MGVGDLAKQFQQQQDDLVQGEKRVRTGLEKTRLSRRERLDTTDLKAAGVDTSNNTLLNSLWDAIVQYNTAWIHPTKMSDRQLADSVIALDSIYRFCAMYMTDKSMKTLNSSGGPAKRQKRYDAFSKLIQDVTKEIESLGGKLLVAPANFQENKRNYWLEKLDPHHRAGFLISAKYNQWVQSKSTDTFWAWLKANGGSIFKGQSKVEGYDKVSAAQWMHCRYFDDNRVLLNSANDLPFCTQGMKTEFSGAGWAVWVCSLPMSDGAGRIGVFVFSYTHLAGYNHHSSFLGGAPVMAAGEWIVDFNGKIRVITGKSGHYMPKWENLHKFVSRFQEIPGDAIIRPNMLDHANGTSTIKFYTVSDFRSRSLNANPLRRSVVLGAISSQGANRDILEHYPGGQKSLSDLLPS